jgi:hypothetical protein
VPRIMRPPMAPFRMANSTRCCTQVGQHVLVAALVLADAWETPPAPTDRRNTHSQNPHTQEQEHQRMYNTAWALAGARTAPPAKADRRNRD